MHERALLETNRAYNAALKEVMWHTAEQIYLIPLSYVYYHLQDLSVFLDHLKWEQ